jgi:hypothetical protein
MKRYVIHPFLFAVFPVLFFFSHNIEQCNISEIFLPLAVVSGVTSLLVVSLGLFIKDFKKVGIMVSTYLFLFFSYGHFYDAIAGWRIAPHFIVRHVCLMSAWGIIFVCGTYFIIKTRKNLYIPTRILNIIAVCLIAVNLFNIAFYIYRNIIASCKPTGGIIKVIGKKTIHIFTNNGTFTSPKSGKIDYLVVGGGGGGGVAYTAGLAAVGGGGGGGVKSGTNHMITEKEYPIVVGYGGDCGYNGSNSSFDGIVANGGGSGGWAPNKNSYNGVNGSSGGGGAGFEPSAGGKGNIPFTSPPQGTNGAYSVDRYIAGGGGGAGTSALGRQGGDGISSLISGSFVLYAGGGSGGGVTDLSGGTGGGGTGGPNSTAGADNTGAGGGGGYGIGKKSISQFGKPGGKGVVIISYNTADFIVNPIFNLFSKKTLNKKANIVYAGKSDVFQDIYYIILDGYASSDILEEVYGYDNQEFINYLNTKGFYVASKSFSNYALTFLSLASSLNMEYINWLTAVLRAESKDRSIPSHMIQDSKVMNFLRSIGYKFIHFSSGWGPTDTNKYADIDIQQNKWGFRENEFTMVFLQTTMLRSFEKYFVKQSVRRKRLFTFYKLAKLHRIKGPKFVFAHINSPHPPYVFGIDGELVKKTKLKMSGNVWEQKDKYLNQLIFINKKVKILIEDILLNSKIPPIIILQADHGTASTFYTDSGGWEKPNERNLKERMGIFNAYYLPKGNKDLLYDFITPVNTFRLILNFYFDANYELLKDKSYYSSYDYPYKFIDVTDTVNYFLTKPSKHNNMLFNE